MHKPEVYDDAVDDAVDLIMHMARDRELCGFCFVMALVGHLTLLQGQLRHGPVVILDEDDENNPLLTMDVAGSA